MLILVTGVMAAGKSSVSQALAERFTPSIHLRGDVFRRFVVNGGVPMAPPITEATLQQLRTRYRAGLAAAQTYASAGFTAVWQDVVVGPILTDVVAAITHTPAHLVVLDPSPEVVATREARRAKNGYGHDWDPAQFVAALRTDTPRLGLWLDTSALTVTQTVDTIVARLAEARLDGARPTGGQDGGRA